MQLMEELHWTKILLVREKGKNKETGTEGQACLIFFNVCMTFLFLLLLSIRIGHIVDRASRPKAVIACILSPGRVLESEQGTRAPHSFAPRCLGAATVAVEHQGRGTLGREDPR